MSYHTLVKDREMVIPQSGIAAAGMTVSNTEMRGNFERLFNVMSPPEYPLATLEKFRDVEGYRWHSEVNRNKAGKNLACALIGAERDWPAQAQERSSHFFEAYDNDRVEKGISNSSVLYPKAKLFGVTTSVVAPIVIKGGEHIWTGQGLSELESLTRKDQLVPPEIMKRVYDLERNGVGFKDGYALFWPDLSYEASKKALFNEQIESIKGDGRKMASFLKSGMRIVKDAVASVANSTAAVAGSVAGSVAQAAGSAIDRMSEIRLEANAVPLVDPVLAGLIFGSVPNDRRVFFIEIGRWV